MTDNSVPPRLPAGPAANDDGPLLTPERTRLVGAAIDDPCDEGGFDQFCRDRHGTLCAFHVQHFRAPDYPCIDLLRHQLAVDFLEEIRRHRAEVPGAAQGSPPKLPRLR